MVKEIHEIQGVSGRIRLELGPDMFEERKEVSGAMVFLFDLGRLVMSRHPRRGWEFPAGKIEPGESPEEAAWRETIEETGATLKNVMPIGFQTVFAHDGSKWVTKMYVAEVDEFTGKPETSETGQVGLFGDLPKDISWKDEVYGLVLGFLSRNALV